MFLTVFLSIWTVLNLYVFQRVFTLPLFKKRARRIALVPAGLFLWSAFPLARILGRRGAADSLVMPLEWIGAYWLGILFLLFVCFLAVDLFTVFGLLFRRRVPGLRTLAFAAAGVLSLIALVQGIRAPVIQEMTVALANLPPRAHGLKVAVITDTHLGTMQGPGWLEARIAQLRDLDPDMVVAVGDIIEGHGAEDRQGELIQLFRGLKPPLGVWAVLGNHERYGGGQTSAEFFRQSGMTVLRNQWQEVIPGLVIAGVDDPGRQDKTESGLSNMEKALEDRPPQSEVIFLSHRPFLTEEASDAGVSLMLSGHTHGGQIWPFGYLAALQNGVMEGREKIGEMDLIVCRGTGTWGPRMRLWKRGEILLITLEPQPR